VPPGRVQKRDLKLPRSTLVPAGRSTTTEDTVARIMVTVPMSFATAGWGIGQMMNPKSPTAPLIGSLLGGLLGLLIADNT
jgi:hypothetical protein